MLDETIKSIKRNNGIDLIRGLSIISVILLHIHLKIPFNQSSLGQLLPQKMINIIFFSGFYGVMTFFVVSGFLITLSSLERWGALSQIPYLSFFKMRFARIAPCLLALLLLLSVLHLANIGGFIITTTTLERAIFSALTFHVNWLEAQTGYLPGPWNVLWSLSVEEAFYVFFPLLCIFVRNEFLFKIMMLVFIILGPFARSVFTHNEMWSDHSYLSCMDGIAIGCLAALFTHQYKLSKKMLLLFLGGGLSLFCSIFILRKQAFDLGLTKIGLHVTLLEMGVAFILIFLHNNSFNSGIYLDRLTAPLRWFGRNSYEIYLTHTLLVMFLVQIFYNLAISSAMIMPWYVLILCLSGVVGHLVAKYYSMPLNRWLRSTFSDPKNDYTQTTLLLGEAPSERSPRSVRFGTRLG
ncbi:MAG: acyltransferase family protein [Candidatus Berkiellales bacterium]